ncbi:MAG TPA: flagellar hook-associated protein FlgL [Burkholderiales bacterium]|nr:flagellar hook-associated protein FlgL [Burkholderiales bacterium]
MRVSTSWIYSSGAADLSRKQAEMQRTQQQLSSGRRVLTPADDPIAASAALAVEQAGAQNDQYARNQGFAQDTLRLVESTLAQAGNTLQDVRELAIQANNDTLGAADRASLAVAVRGKIAELLGTANTRDGAGGYLFSGYQDSVQPFASTVAGVAYQGDQGSRALQVGATRQIGVSASGAEVFEGAHSGNGRFTVAAAAANSGGAIADTGQVTDPAALTGHAYKLVFSVSGPATTYDVIDTATSSTVTSGATYTPGSAIGFGGMQFTVSGAPANGDTFTLAPSARQSVFKTLDDLASLLEGSASGAVTQAQFHTGVGNAIASLDQANDHLLAVRTDVGARLGELDSLASQTSSAGVLQKQDLSRLVDLDYAEAASRLAQQQTSLQAAQQSYLRVTGLSLFNFL